MARTPDEKLEPLRRAILNRICLSEQWLDWTRGPTLAELVERFADAGETVERAKDAVRGQILTMASLGWIERRKRGGPPPTVFYIPTPLGREVWFHQRAEGLPMEHEACIGSGIDAHEPYPLTRCSKT